MSERDIFLAAIDLPDGERSAYLHRACGADAGLRERVDALLRSHDAAGSFMNEPAADPADAATVAFTPNTDTDEDDEVPLGFLDPPGRPDSLGRLGHYDVLEVLGKGGFGVVFRAFDDRLQRVVAVKVLSPQMATTSPARKRFLREARSSAAVRHENVVPVHDVAEQPLPHLVMDYIPGETLQQRIKRIGPLELTEVLRVGRQIAAGLAAAHATGLIHRDIKPSNILLDTGPNPVAKITDFGLARAADDASLTRSGTVAGTPMYMSPEQAKAETLDHRSDLFSLGSVLYVMAAGRPPFRAETTLAVLKRVAEDTPRPIREVIPEVPEWFCRIVEKLHAKAPAERFQTAQEVADLLADCERQLADGNKLTDYARIPGGKPKSARWRWQAWAWAAVWLAVCGLPVAWLAAYLINASWPKTQPEDDHAQLAINWEGKDLVVMVYGEDGIEYLNEGKSKGLGMTLKPGTYTIRAQRGGEVVFERKVTLGPRDHLGVDIPANPPPADGFTPLFNGKDLTGWQPHPDAPGDWRVEDGAIVGRGSTSLLVSGAGDYANFHLRTEVKINATGDSGIVVRIPPDGLPADPPAQSAFTGGYEAQIAVRSNYAVHTGSVFTDNPVPQSVPLIQKAPLMMHRPDEWFVLEVIAEGDRIRTRVNGKPAVEYRDDPLRYPRGRLALHVWGNNITFVQFRKIEIKELPASTPAVPKTAADVLPYLAGDWKAELESIGPQLPPAETITSGELTFDFVAGKKFLRQRGGPAGEFGQPHFLYSFDAAQGLRRCIAWSVGATAGPVVGTFNPDSRTLLWMHHIPTEGPYNVEMHFADGDTIKVRTFRLDPDGKIHRETRLVFTRLKRPAALTLLPPDPKRPDEAKVLDRLAGEWRNEQTVTAGGQAMRETSRVTANFILGGRFVEEQVTNDATGASDYTLAWYDPAAKAYRRWYFSGGGPVTELTGTWDDAAKTMTWTAADKRTVAVEKFTGDDRSEFRITVKDEEGQTVSETVGTARRVGGRPAPKPARLLFDEKEAKQLQEAWAKHVGETVEFADKTVGMEFRVIPPGEFQMGAADAEVRDDIERAKKGQHQASKLMVRALEAGLPQHPVRITRPFAIGKHEVTVGQFRQFVTDHKYTPTGPDGGSSGLVNGELVKGKEYAWDKVGYEQSDLHPVWNVSAEDAIAFCQWLSKKDGRTYRLPTEAEWEWACRAGTAGPTFFPPKDIHEYAALRAKTARKTEPVGGKRKANPFGLHDTCGNVWEWCSDWYAEGYYKTLPADTPTDDPTGPPGPGKPSAKTTHRVQRGGSAFLIAGHATNSNGRGFGEQEGCGFRVVCELVPK